MATGWWGPEQRVDLETGGARRVQPPFLTPGEIQPLPNLGGYGEILFQAVRHSPKRDLLPLLRIRIIAAATREPGWLQII